MVLGAGEIYGSRLYVVFWPKIDCASFVVENLVVSRDAHENSGPTGSLHSSLMVVERCLVCDLLVNGASVWIVPVPNNLQHQTAVLSPSESDVVVQLNLYGREVTSRHLNVPARNHSAHRPIEYED
jgi:hypothetical protein